MSNHNEALEQFITDQRNHFEVCLTHYQRAFALCESPIEQLLLLQWFSSFRMSFSPETNSLGGDGLWTWCRFAVPDWKMTITPQQAIALDGTNFRVDFLCEFEKGSEAPIRVVIELDGHDFHERTKEQATRDKKRDRLFTQHGYTVLRFTGSEVFKDPAQVMCDIFNAGMKLSA